LIAKDASASTNALADQLNVAAPSVSSMLSKLQDLGFVEHERYRGVRLTKSGSREALRLLRGHRLIETFLLEHLNYTWDEVHEEAERLEHAVSEDFTERLAELLGHPTHDPHGDPIPGPEGDFPNTPNTPLAEVEVGHILKVYRLMTQTADVLNYIAELGIHPGQRIQVRRSDPIGGLIHVHFDDRTEILSKEMAMLICGQVFS
jgi:DtxR family Mn-dependent transcriptional regulator